MSNPRDVPSEPIDPKIGLQSDLPKDPFLFALLRAQARDSAGLEFDGPPPRPGDQRPAFIDDFSREPEDVTLQGRLRAWFDRLGEAIQSKHKEPSLFEPPSFNRPSSAEMPASVAFLALASLILLPTAWPVALYFLLAVVAWWNVRRFDNVFCDAIVDVLIPTMIGLLLLCLLVMYVNLISHTASAHFLAMVEVTLASWLGVFKEWSEWLELPTSVVETSRIMVFVALLSSLVLVAYLFPRWRPVPKYLALKKVLSFLVIMFTVMTSFTFFSKYPAVAWRDHARAYVIDKTAELDKQEKTSLARYAAAETLKQAAKTIDPFSRMRLHEIAGMIDEETTRPGNIKSRSRVFPAVGARITVELQENPPTKAFASRFQPHGNGPPKTKTAADLLAGLERIKVEHSKAEEAEKLEGHVKELLKDAVSTLASRLPIPERIKTGLLQGESEFYEQTFDTLIGRIFEGLAASMFSRLAGSLPAGADQPNQSALSRARSIEPPAEITRTLLTLASAQPPKPGQPSRQPGLLERILKGSSLTEGIGSVGTGLPIDRGGLGLVKDDRSDPYLDEIRANIGAGWDQEFRGSLDGKPRIKREKDFDEVADYLKYERTHEEQLRAETHGPAAAREIEAHPSRSSGEYERRYEFHEEFRPVEIR